MLRVDYFLKIDKIDKALVWFFPNSLEIGS